MNPEEMKKRRMESISSMQAAIDLFSETLAFADPTQEDLSTNSLIKVIIIILTFNFFRPILILTNK